MLINNILGLDEVESIFLVEESLEDLLYLPVTVKLLSDPPDFDASIDIVDGDILGTAFHINEPASAWLLLTDLYSEDKLLSTYKTKAGRSAVGCNRGRFFEALVEYFSVSLKEELFCESCDLPVLQGHVEERIDRLQTLLSPLIRPGTSIMEIGCGSGMGTRALHAMGLDPWAVEIDRCELCSGLKGGYLSPYRSMALDAMLLSRFFPEKAFDAVVGFMVGLIEDVNWPLWREILLSSSRLARDQVVFTAYTKKEVERVAETMRAAGFEGCIIDNHSELVIYDQWAFLGTRSLHAPGKG